jgi:hypothetical protein
VKNIAYLVIALVVLIAIYTFLGRSKPVVSTTDRPLIEADSASITQLDIHSAKGDVTLIKQGNGWKISGEKTYPVNEKMLGGVLSKFSQMSKKALISKRPEKLAEMEVDESAGVKVTVHTGDKSSVIILGKAGPTMQTCYARLDGSDEVWEISGNHRASFDRKRDDWRDKTINNYELADFQRYVLTSPEQSFTLELQDSIWHVKAGATEFDADSKIVERLSRMMSRMNTVEFADTLAADVFDRPVFQIVATLKSGENVELKLVKKDEEKYFLRKTGAATDFVVYNATANALMKKPDEFKPGAKSE